MHEEPLRVLRSMHEAARTYYTKNGGQLPPTVGMTPDLGTCCQWGGQCAPKSDDWKQPTWKALGFELKTMHRYSYAFENNVETNGTFTVRAKGDLDCDQNYSTFEFTTEVPKSGELPKMGELEVKDQFE